MMIETISEVATQVTALAGNGHVQAFGNVCAKAPSQEAEGYAKDIVGWVKWGVIWLLIGAGFASAGLMVAGKISQSGRAAQMGSSGMFWTVIGAVGFAVIYGILTGIVGNGC
ncbi:hypothetical protein [Nocardioides sp.]|uniref:hypothetical protein n=1 Tax=Nocardioides sp. TaxID=35761 RepID=UPI00273621E3|nr:hypothetical protein [Nocardioides sp.]MDP3892280.1 hypothetical protein [Nocardioides sp.]